MARPRKHGERVATGLRLPKDLHDRLLAVCEERDTTINHLACKALERYLDAMPPLPQAAESGSRDGSDV